MTESGPCWAREAAEWRVRILVPKDQDAWQP